MKHLFWRHYQVRLQGQYRQVSRPPARSSQLLYPLIVASRRFVKFRPHKHR